MKLFKWNATDLKPKFSNIVEKFFGKNINVETATEQEVSTVPSVNIANEEKAFEVSIAVPSLEKKDVTVEIKNNTLVISSEKQYSNEEKDKNWVRKEYGYASFQRIFQLPNNVDENKIQATMNNGILTIKIAKDEKFLENKKLIEIK